MFFKTILIAYTLSLLSQCLRLHDALDSYVQYLEEQQKTIKNKLDSLAAKIDSNYKLVQQQMNIDKKIALLEQYFRQQTLLLDQIYLETANKQINSSQSVCPAISNASKEQINSDITEIKNNLLNLSKLLAPLNDNITGPGVEQTKQFLKNAIQTTDDLKSFLLAKGKQVDPSSINLEQKTNLIAPNWVLGESSINEVNNEYKKAAQSGNLRICNFSEPYYSKTEKKCVACEGDKKFFSLATSECLQCYNFDNSSHHCKDNQGSLTNILPATLNLIIVPPGKKIEDYNKNLPKDAVFCPQKTPFYTGSKCVSCDAYFDIQKKQCTTCQDNKHYDPKTHTCQLEQTTVSNLDAGKNSLIIPNEKTLADISNDNTKLAQQYKLNVCQAGKPYFNDYECISCAEGTQFSLISKSCGTCQAGTFFNKTTNHCEKKLFYSNLNDPNWVSALKQTQILNKTQSYQKNQSYQKCPIQKPFWNQKQCMKCQNNEHFNYDKFKCQKCLDGQYFNPNAHQCLYAQNNFQTNPEKTPKLIFEGRPKNQWMYLYYQNIQKNQGMADCSSEKPYFDGFSCILCPEDRPYFNLEYKLCQKCSQGTQYDEAHHECLTTQGNIVSQVPTLEKMAAGIFS